MGDTSVHYPLKWPRAKQNEWADGWDGSPTLAAAPRWTQAKGGIGVELEKKYHDRLYCREKKTSRKAGDHWFRPGGDGYNKCCPTEKKHTGFRDSWLDQHQRITGWVPGPGAFKTSRDFEDLSGDKNASLTKSTGKISHPDEIDSKLTIHHYRGAHTIPKADRVASVTQLEKVRRMLMPSSFCNVKRDGCPPGSKVPGFATRTTTWPPRNRVTPGPGHYDQHTSFGQSSGPTRNRYLATNHGDTSNTAPKRIEKFTRTTKADHPELDPKNISGMGRKSFSTPAVI